MEIDGSAYDPAAIVFDSDPTDASNATETQEYFAGHYAAFGGWFDLPKQPAAWPDDPASCDAAPLWPVFCDAASSQNVMCAPGHCYDPATSPVHCGASADCVDPGAVCSAGETCQSGLCTPSSP